MDLLDARTVLVGYVVISAVSAVIIVSLWARNRGRAAGSGYWAAGFALQPIGFILFSLRGIIDNFSSIIVANVLVTVGLVLVVSGLREHVGLKPARWFNWAYVGLFTAVHLYFTYVLPSLAVRNINGSLAIFLMMCEGVWAILWGPRETRNPRNAWVAVWLVLYAALSVVRIAGIVFEPAARVSAGLGGLDTWVVLAYSANILALAIALLLLVNDELFADLERESASLVAAQKALVASESKFSVAFQEAPYGMLVTRLADGMIVSANPKTMELIGATEDEVVGHTTVDVGAWTAEQRAEFVGLMTRDDELVDFETTLMRKDGTTFMGALSGGLFDIDGERHTLIIMRDITAEKAAQRELHFLSERDSLTGLFNQRAFYSRATERLHTLDDQHAAFIYMDMDRLKEINDRYGHQAGDRALAAFSEALKRGYRDSDLVGRLGGDEFAVLAVSRESASDDALKARFLDELAEVNHSGELPFEVHASIGIATFDGAEGPADLQAMIGLADSRMYEAKRRTYARG